MKRFGLNFRLVKYVTVVFLVLSVFMSYNSVKAQNNSKSIPCPAIEEEEESYVYFALSKINEINIAASYLTQRAEKKDFLNRLTESISTIVGVLVLFMVLVLKKGKYGKHIMLIAAFVLIIGPEIKNGWNVLIRTENPRQLKTYSESLREHKTNILMILENPSLDGKTKVFQLHQEYKLAEKSLQEIYNIWGEIEVKTKLRLRNEGSLVCR